MQLLFALTVLTAAVMTGCLASIDLSCSCHIWNLRHVPINLHCTKGKNGGSRINCQKDTELDIPPGYQYIPGYALIKEYFRMKTFAQAKKACEDEGALLAIPRDKTAYAGLKKLLKASRMPWAWIGISDQLVQGQYLGVDGRPVSYLPWSQGQPDNYGNNEDCANYNSDEFLNDSPCGNTGPYLCERRLTVSVPDDYVWVPDAARFYRVHSEKRMHVEAVRTCSSENARLAVTDTSRRTDALLAQFSVGSGDYQLYHVGFTDEATEGDFVTETGRHQRHMEFQEWEENEPRNNDNGKPENCLALSVRGFYNDVRCDRELPFICEILPV